MAESSDFARRVFVEDLRHDGKYLRVTWHREHGAFVLSHWQDDVCVAATRVRAEDVPRLVNVLTSGLADAAAQAGTSTAGPSPQNQTLWATLRDWLSSKRAERRPSSVVPIRPAARAVDQIAEPRWKAGDVDAR